MAISTEEQTLRDETRTALLKAIKSGAEAVEENHRVRDGVWHREARRQGGQLLAMERGL
jgi:hypothetical protein